MENTNLNCHKDRKTQRFHKENFNMTPIERNKNNFCPSLCNLEPLWLCGNYLNDIK
jgi:hypothetical protein